MLGLKICNNVHCVLYTFCTNALSYLSGPQRAYLSKCRRCHAACNWSQYMKTWNFPRISPGVSDASICSWAMEDEGQTRFNVDTTSKSFMHRLSRTDLEISIQKWYRCGEIAAKPSFWIVGTLIVVGNHFLLFNLFSRRVIQSHQGPQCSCGDLAWVNRSCSRVTEAIWSHARRAEKHIYRAITLNGFNPIHHYSSNWNQN